MLLGLAFEALHSLGRPDPLSGLVTPHIPTTQTTHNLNIPGLWDSTLAMQLPQPAVSSCSALSAEILTVLPGLALMSSLTKTSLMNNQDRTNPSLPWGLS